MLKGGERGMLLQNTTPSGPATPMVSSVGKRAVSRIKVSLHASASRSRIEGNCPSVTSIVWAPSIMRSS